MLSKRLFMALIVWTLGASMVLRPAAAQAEVGYISSAPLCLPGVYMTNPQDCLALGPSGYITQLASSGMRLPLTVVPAHPIDASLGEVPFSYASLGDVPTPV